MNIDDEDEAGEGDEKESEDNLYSQSLVSDQEIIESVWSYRTAPTPLHRAPAEVVSDILPPTQPSLLNIASPLPERGHLISPLRKQAIKANIAKQGAAFANMFQLPSYTVGGTPDMVTNNGEMKAEQTPTSSPSLPPSASPSRSPSRSPVPLDIPASASADIVVTAFSQSPPPAASSSAASSSPSPDDSRVVDLHDMQPTLASSLHLVDNGPRLKDFDQVHMDEDDTAIARNRLVRDEKIHHKTEDAWFATKMMKKASKIGTALGLMRRNMPQTGEYRETPLPKVVEPSAFPNAGLAVHSLVHMFHNREQHVEQLHLAELKSIERKKEIAHQQYMKLVMRHVRTRLIQEQRFVQVDEDGNNAQFDFLNDPSDEYATQLAIRQRDKWKGEDEADFLKSIDDSINNSAFSKLPISQRNVAKEVLGSAATAKRKLGKAISALSRQMSGAKEEQIPDDMTVNNPSLGKTFSTQNNGVSLLSDEDLSFHIDPLDPIRPENRNKQYKLNLQYNPIVLHGGEYSINSRGPWHDWQALQDDEEVATYNKIVWLCSIKAFHDVPLDGMMKIILNMKEKAYDVEILFRSGELNCTTFYLVKSGEAELKMERKVLEAIEERRHMIEASQNGLQVPEESKLLGYEYSNVSESDFLPQLTRLSHTLLPTDKLLKTHFIEIARLGSTGIIGEDILLSNTRRYTAISLTPVWLYEVDRDVLLSCFLTQSSRQHFLAQIDHVQRVRERHALVRSRNRMKLHSHPTLFNSFLDDSIDRNLTKNMMKNKISSLEASASVAAITSKNNHGNNHKQHRTHGVSPEKILVGGAEALRAVLSDLNTISQKLNRNAKKPRAKHEQSANDSVDSTTAAVAASDSAASPTQPDLLNVSSFSPSHIEMLVSHAAKQQLEWQKHRREQEKERQQAERLVTHTSNPTSPQHHKTRSIKSPVELSPSNDGQAHKEEKDNSTPVMTSPPLHQAATPTSPYHVLSPVTLNRRLNWSSIDFNERNKSPAHSPARALNTLPNSKFLSPVVMSTPSTTISPSVTQIPQSHHRAVSLSPLVTSTPESVKQLVRTLQDRASPSQVAPESIISQSAGPTAFAHDSAIYEKSMLVSLPTRGRMAGSISLPTSNMSSYTLHKSHVSYQSTPALRVQSSSTVSIRQGAKPNAAATSSPSVDVDCWTDLPTSTADAFDVASPVYKTHNRTIKQFPWINAKKMLGSSASEPALALSGKPAVKKTNSITRAV